MKTRLLLSIFAAMPLFAVTCPLGTTHIVDPLPTNDGSTPAYGKILVKGPSSPAGSVISTTQTVTISGGGVDFCLIGGPAVKYAVTYLLTSSTGKATTSWAETWIVPATTSTLAIKQLWGGSSAPQYLISPQQINSNGLAPGQIWVWDGNSWIPATNAAGGAGQEQLAMKGLANGYAGLDATGHVAAVYLPTVPGLLGYTPQDTLQKGANNGYAPLDASGRVPSLNLPVSSGGGGNFWSQLTAATWSTLKP